MNIILPNDLFRRARIVRRWSLPSQRRRICFVPNKLRAWIVPTLALAVLASLAYELGAQSAPAAAAKTRPGKASARTNSAAKIAAIKSFRIIQEKSGPALELLATHPMIPAIQLIENPTRLVIDVPNARVDMQEKRVSVQSDDIKAVRADQFQANPPVARIVVDLVSPRTYTWDSAGNRLVVHLGKNPTEAGHSPFQPSPEASLMREPQPVVKSVRAAGPLVLATNAGAVGSSFTAGADAAEIDLSSGGQLRVCPRTTLSITPSQNKHNLLLGMNTGALEAHLQLDASSDTVMTPDFRIMLVGPGEFHYAFSADSQGNTCVRALPGNAASAIVTELMGDRTYQVKATDQLVFRGGQLDRVDMNVPLECGCPPPQVIERAATSLPAEDSTARRAQPTGAANSPSPESQPLAVPASSVDVPPAPSTPNELHVQISAPLVFHASGPPPAPVEDVRALPLDARGPQAPELNVAPAPPPIPQAQRASAENISGDARPRGFFHKLGHFFSSIFH